MFYAECKVFSCLRDSPAILCRAEKGRNKTQASSIVTFHFEPSLSGNSSNKLLFGGWGGCSSPRIGNVPGGFQQAVNPLLGIRQLGVVWQGQAPLCQQQSVDITRNVHWTCGWSPCQL